MNINVRIDDHSAVPLEHWQEQLKRQRRKREPRPVQPEPPAKPEKRPPEGSIDEYAAPFPG